MEQISNRVKAELLLNFYAKRSGGQIENGVLTIISKELGLSRERIRQFAVGLHFTMPHSVRKRTSNCKICGIEIQPTVAGRQRVYCSEECWNKSREKYYTTSPCMQCEKPMRVLKSNSKYRIKKFCSKVCQGKYLGEHYGSNSGWRLSMQKYPRDSKTLLEKLGKEFTVQEFATVFHAPGLSGAYNVLADLVFMKKVRKLEQKFHYEVI